MVLGLYLGKFLFCWNCFCLGITTNLGSLIDLLLIFFIVLSFNPLFLILVFMAYLFCLSLFLIFLLNSYYYSYLTCLLFLSGLLVMFMYVCSVISNEKIYLNFNFFFFLILFLVWGLGSYLGDLMVLLGGVGLVYFEFFNLLKFFVFSFNLFSVFFVFYLFFCLIVVYEIIKKNRGPLRMSI